jgi:hypothetical protein
VILAVVAARTGAFTPKPECTPLNLSVDVMSG